MCYTSTGGGENMDASPTKVAGAVLIALWGLGFLGTAMVARFIEGRGA